MNDTTPYTPELLEQQLRAGADHNGTHTMKAAVHLLVFTEVLHRQALVDHLSFGRTNIATVRNWVDLLDSPAAARLGGGAHRLLTIAAALAGGLPIDLRDAVRGLGHAHAQRVVEAIAIATGYPEAAAAAS